MGPEEVLNKKRVRCAHDGARGRQKGAVIARCRLRVWVDMVLAGMALAWCPCALALDQVLDVSQYAHTAWKVREGFSKAPSPRLLRRPTVISGWVRN